MLQLGASAVPFRYIDPNLMLTHEQISYIRDENLKVLLRCKKLQLVLDLDHTLLHSMAVDELAFDEKERTQSEEDVYEIMEGKYLVKLRPGIREFIKEVSRMFDVSIYTMGRRHYAEEVRTLLVSKVGFPKNSWVIAREDCLVDRQKTLDVVLSHERVVLIVDDTEEVWGNDVSGNKSNLINIGRYNYFSAMKRRKDDTELGRVLSILMGVHVAFFEGSEYIGVSSRKDVRGILKSIISLTCMYQPTNKRICNV